MKRPLAGPRLTWAMRTIKAARLLGAGRSTNPLAEVIHDTAPVDTDAYVKYHTSNQWGR